LVRRHQDALFRIATYNAKFHPPSFVITLGFQITSSYKYEPGRPWISSRDRCACRLNHVTHPWRLSWPWRHPSSAWPSCSPFPPSARPWRRGA
jgi:hypothetical protein